MKNFLAFIFGFFLAFGLVGRSYSATIVSYSFENVTYVYGGSITSNGFLITPVIFNRCTGLSSGSGSLSCNNVSKYTFTRRINYSDGTSTTSNLSTGWFCTSSGDLRSFTGECCPIGTTFDPVSNTCKAPPTCADRTGESLGTVSVPGKDFSFNYCSGDCALDSSSLVYDSANDRTIMTASINGKTCASGASVTPVSPTTPPIPTCPDGQIWSPADSACVPISSGTGIAPKSTDTTYPDSSPTYDPGDSGYGTPILPGAPAPVTGPQTTISGEKTTTTTTVNPDGSVTEETQKEETDTPLDAPDGQSESYGKPSKTINFQNFNASLNGFAQGGPVRLFSDMVGVVQSLVATPAAPVFRFPLAGNYFVIDLTPFDPVAAVSRFMLSLFALVALGFFLLKQWRAG